jgi:hypothetical protein
MRVFRPLYQAEPRAKSRYGSVFLVVGGDIESRHAAVTGRSSISKAYEIEKLAAA